MSGSTFDVDSIIERLLLLRDRKNQRLAKLTEVEIKRLVFRAQKVFINQPVVLELGTPLRVCGDVHGQYSDLLRLFDYGGYPPEANYLFLGDYVDRGKRGLETVCLLLAYKVKYPENFFMLRGNHEAKSVNRLYGFYDECRTRYSVKLWKVFSDCFDFLPMAAIIDESIFCVHGGLSPDLDSVKRIKRLERPLMDTERGLVCDLIWSDPSEETSNFGFVHNGVYLEDYGENDRGVSVVFGQKVIDKFLRAQDMDLIVRAHQVVENGYEFFGGKRSLVTIFSAPNYCGEFDNSGAQMHIDSDLVCSFKVLKPVPTEDVPDKGTYELPPTPLRKRKSSNFL